MHYRMLFQSALAFTLIAACGVATAAGSGSKKSGMVAPSADAVKPLKVGDKLPNVKIKTAEGKSEKLNKALEDKASVIVFYRGSWCPYCMNQLKQLESISGELAEHGVNVVTIAPDKPSVIAETINKGSFTMTMFSDSKLDAAKAMGVAFQLDPDTAKRYAKHLKESTGEDSGQLPVPAVFLVDKSGKITYVFSNPDYKVRLSNEELLEAVKSTLGS